MNGAAESRVAQPRVGGAQVGAGGDVRGGIACDLRERRAGGGPGAGDPGVPAERFQLSTAYERNDPERVEFGVAVERASPNDPALEFFAVARGVARQVGAGGRREPFLMGDREVQRTGDPGRLVLEGAPLTACVGAGDRLRPEDARRGARAEHDQREYERPGEKLVACAPRGPPASRRAPPRRRRAAARLRAAGPAGRRGCRTSLVRVLPFARGVRDLTPHRDRQRATSVVHCPARGGGQPGARACGACGRPPSRRRRTATTATRGKRGRLRVECAQIRRPGGHAPAAPRKARPAATRRGRASLGLQAARRTGGTRRRELTEGAARRPRSIHTTVRRPFASTIRSTRTRAASIATIRTGAST